MNKDLFKSPIRRFIETKINGGAILLFVALIAMIIANSPFREHYNSLFAQEVVLQFGNFSLFHSHGNNMSFLALINDALMAVFFFSVGLEIKREVLVGELSSPRKAMLPVVAACGGMIIPVLLFLLFSPAGAAAKGAAIPMATDIAFSLGVLSLLGKKVPLSLKIFLTAFAVVDDIGGIIVIGVLQQPIGTRIPAVVPALYRRSLYRRTLGHLQQIILYLLRYHRMVSFPEFRNTPHHCGSYRSLYRPGTSQTRPVALHGRHPQKPRKSAGAGHAP